MCSRKWLFLSLCRCDFVLHSILFKHSVHFLSNKPKTEFKAYILIGYLIFLENGSQTEGNLEELNKLREKETVIDRERETRAMKLPAYLRRNRENGCWILPANSGDMNRNAAQKKHLSPHFPPHVG